MKNEICGFFKRCVAGALTVATIVGSMATGIPTAFAAQEDDKASKVEINVGDDGPGTFP